MIKLLVVSPLKKTEPFPSNTLTRNHQLFYTSTSLSQLLRSLFLRWLSVQAVIFWRRAQGLSHSLLCPSFSM